MKLAYIAASALMAGASWALITTAATATEVYRWVDEDGVTQFTAKPPKNRQATEISPSTGHSEPVDYSEYNQNPAPDDASPKPEHKPDKVTAAKQREACETARDNLETLQGGGRIAVEENGERRYLNEEEVQQRTEQAQRIINETC